MKLLPAVVGSRGRVVLPAEVRAALGLAKGDTLFFVITAGQVRLVRSPADFGEYLALFGSGPADDPLDE